MHLLVITLTILRSVLLIFYEHRSADTFIRYFDGIRYKTT